MYLRVFCECVETIISGVKSNNAMFICGYFIVHILKHNYHKFRSVFLAITCNFGLYHLITKLSRITRIGNAVYELNEVLSK